MSKTIYNYPVRQDIKDMDSGKILDLLIWRSRDSKFFRWFRSTSYTIELMVEYLSRGYDPHINDITNVYYYVIDQIKLSNHETV